MSPIPENISVEMSSRALYALLVFSPGELFLIGVNP